MIARDMLGDLVNTTGAIRALCEKFPGTTFTLEGGLSAGSLGLRGIQVWTRPRHGGFPERLRRVSRMRNGKFGACIVLDDGHTHARLARLAGIGNVYGIHHGKPSLFTAAVSFDADGHDVFDQQNRLLELFGISGELRPCLEPGLQEIRSAGALFAALGEPEVLIHPGASDPAKTWPNSRWSELIAGLGRHKVAVIGGPGEVPARFGKPSPTNPPTVLEYAALLDRVEVLVTPDTGPAHLAAAMKTPTVVIYGPTDPRHYHPWPNGNQTLLYRDQGCRHYGSGCAHRTGGLCPQHCSQAVRVEEVVAAVADLSQGDGR